MSAILFEGVAPAGQGGALVIQLLMENLVGHVEQRGLWSIEGGMRRLPEALARAAAAKGVRFRYGTEVSEVVVAGGLIGKVSKMGESIVSVEVANGVELQVQRASVVQVLPKGTYGK